MRRRLRGSSGFVGQLQYAFHHSASSMGCASLDEHDNSSHFTNQTPPSSPTLGGGDRSGEGVGRSPSHEVKSEATLEERFLGVSRHVKESSKSGVNEEQQLRLYALYKQGTLGACDIEQPSSMDMVASAKHGAWKSLSRMPISEAMNKYVLLAAELFPASKASYLTEGEMLPPSPVSLPSTAASGWKEDEPEVPQHHRRSPRTRGRPTVPSPCSVLPSPRPAPPRPSCARHNAV